MVVADSVIIVGAEGSEGAGTGVVEDPSRDSLGRTFRPRRSYSAVSARPTLEPVSESAREKLESDRAEEGLRDRWTEGVSDGNRCREEEGVRSLGTGVWEANLFSEY